MVKPPVRPLFKPQIPAAKALNGFKNGENGKRDFSIGRSCTKPVPSSRLT
jgi:hypothetical protein